MKDDKINVKTRIRCFKESCIYNYHGICYSEIITIDENLKCLNFTNKHQ
jgi:hypothetical protein